MRSLLQRRRIGVLAVPLVAGMLALAACGSSSASDPGSSAGSTITISVGLAGNIFDLPLRVAEQDGYYKREGLNVKFLTVTATSDNAALDSGGIAFLPQAPAGWAEALTKGSPQVAVESEATGIPLGLIVGKKYAAAHGITSATSAASVAKDLVGSTGGLSSTWTQAEALLYLKEFGVTSSQLKIVTLTSIAADVAALKSGEIDWFATSEPIPLEAQGAGDGLVVAGPSNVPAWAQSKTGYGTIILAMKSYLSSNPSIVKKFVTATEQATAYVGTHESAVLPVLEEIFPGVSASLLEEAYREVSWPSNGKMTAAEWGTTADFINSEGVLPSQLGFSAADWTNQYLP